MIVSNTPSETPFVPHPDSGGEFVKAVVVDVTPTRDSPDKFHPGKTRTTFKIVFESETLTGDKNDAGIPTRFCIWSFPLTPTLHEKSNLRKMLKDIMGRSLTDAELAGFDVESIVGMPVKLIVAHTDVDGETYANIAFLAKDTAGIKPSGTYVRVQDRPDKPAWGGTATATPPSPAAKTAPVSAGDVIIHVGKLIGTKLRDADDADIGRLISHWLPGAKATGNAVDLPLIAALEMLDAKKDEIPF